MFESCSSEEWKQFEVFELGAVASGRAWSAWLPPSHCVSSQPPPTLLLLPKPCIACATAEKVLIKCQGFSAHYTSVKVDVILQEQLPTTPGPEETAHIPVHRYSGSQALRHEVAKYLDIQGTQVPSYSRYPSTKVFEVPKYSSPLQSVVLATSHHLWPGGNCRYVCSPARKAAFSRLFPSFQLSPTIPGGSRPPSVPFHS